MIPPAMYEQMARCLREYQLSPEQEAALYADEAFMRWYESKDDQ